MKLSEPYTKEELKNAAETLKINFAKIFNDLPDEIFFQQFKSGWSPAENIQHITKVTRVLALSFSTPKFLSSLVFGEIVIPAPGMNHVANIYLEALRKGQNSGPFTPTKENPEGEVLKRKKDLLNDWNKYWDKYKLAIDSWSEEQLDKILMPHPFLGKIPAREMYMIGLLHLIHHLEILSKRLGTSWSYF